MLTSSLDFSTKKMVHLSLVEGGRGGWTIQMTAMVISEATNMKIAARKAALQNLRHRSIIKLSKNLL